MREVAGYLTEDGTFFERLEEAEVHESVTALSGAYKQYVGPNSNFDRFQNVIINLAPEIRRFLNAVEGPEQRESTAAEVEQATIEREIIGSPKTDQHSSDDGLGGSFEAVVEQPDRGSMYVSDVGDSPRPEKVFVRRKVDGA